MLYGVDVSSYQGTGEIPESVDFVIARATYGVQRDKRCQQHAERVRAMGATLGLYHFFLPTKSVAEQLRAFDGVADQCGLTVGDMIPWVDVEAYPGAGGKWVPPAPEWGAQLQCLLAEMDRTWGRAGVYLTNSDWLRLGSPAWLVERPLWVAHWIGEKNPATPGKKPWVIHQYRVGPYQEGAKHESGQHDDQGAIDHDRADTLLPLITAAHTRPGVLTGMPPMIDLYAESLASGSSAVACDFSDDGFAPDFSPLSRYHCGGTM